MRTWPVLVVALAGCGPTAPPPASPQAQCERLIADDPDIIAAKERQMTLVMNSPGEEQSGLAGITRRKMAECLRVRGVMTPGGVQPVQR